ncbi:response regulator [Massilia sp. TWP1-3-3]|uniref:hybrid sensor histidine kinase/response regulator n=1 Tax=Massilia sp. TWP1-3-3 TaxID=2804573 RepID=UPI003CF911D6
MTALPTSDWRIVIIDDSPDDCGEIRRLLLRGSMERRYIFSESQTGGAGVDAVLRSPALPDCVVLDFNLPDMDALDVLAALAGPDGLPICPVVVLTGGTGPEVGRLVLRAGAQDYIAKDGLTPLALTRIVENAVERLTMARELIGRNAALTRSEKALSDADRRKNEFIATLAHELRNPLAPIASGLQVLRLRNDFASSHGILDIMERQLCQVTRLIDDLLDISRITSGKVLLRLQRVLVDVVMEEAAEAAQPLICAAQHTLHVTLPQQPLWIEADPARLVQMIGNLLSNSAKYSENGSTIALSARSEGANVVIEVADTGLGIPRQMLDQVFDMFTQINNTLDRGQGGLGIGLALVRQLVEMHGGSIAAESAGPGLGSTFSIRLPIAAAPPNRFVTLPVGMPAQLPRRRVLVVDDNVDAVTMLTMMLDLSGHQTCSAFSGEEALMVAIDFLPDVVFMDIGLPGMSGYEAARQFRAAPQLQAAFLIALTGWGSAEDRRRSNEAGFDAHLTKPVEFAAIDTMLRQFRTNDNDRGVASQAP